MLVVDDEKNMRLSLQTVLKDENYPARAVDSAEEALSLLAQEEFFMVITDARLGGMSGYEFLAKVHNAMARTAGAHDHRLRHAQAGRRGHQGRAPLITWPSRSRRRNCCMPSRAAPNATGCCRKTPRCAPAPPKFSASNKSWANRRACTICGN